MFRSYPKSRLQLVRLRIAEGTYVHDVNWRYRRPSRRAIRVSIKILFTSDIRGFEKRCSERSAADTICIECGVAKFARYNRRETDPQFSIVGARLKPATRHPQERIVIEKADQEEEETVAVAVTAAAVTAAAAATRPTISAVEHELREKTEVSTCAGMPAATRTDDATVAVVVPASDPPTRPANLNLAKQEVNLADAPNVASPTSPTSKQVGESSSSLLGSVAQLFRTTKETAVKEKLENTKRSKSCDVTMSYA